MTSTPPSDLPPYPQAASSVWQLKPWWCQPWSILLTGVVLVAGSWFVFHKIWLTVLVALPISIWQGYFLLIYPRLMASIAAEAKSNLS